MFIQNIQTILLRDLAKLREEIQLYKNPEDLWKVLPGTANTGGNLALHLVGNLRHFIGSMMGTSGYIRNRDAEFADTGLTKEELYTFIELCIKEISESLGKLSADVLENEFPQAVGGKTHTYGYMLIHLTSHFAYHLGQVNYHRRFFSVS